MRSPYHSLTCSILMFALSACAPMAATYYDGIELDNRKNADQPANDKPELWCFDGKVDLELRASVNRFDMVSGTSVHAGFGGIPGIAFQALGFNVKYSSGQLDTTMSLYQALKTTELTTQSGRGEKRDVVFGFDILAGWGGGFEYQSQTPIYDLSQAALVDNLNKLVSVLPKLGLEQWSTHVIDVYPEENGFVIPVGFDAGVQPGDEFKIMSVVYDWAGEPCESELRMTRVKSKEPIAVAIAEEVRTDVSFLRVIESNGQEIEKYAYVTISELVSPNPKKPRTTLARSIRIGRVSSQPLRFKVDQSGREELIDIAPMVYEQLKVLLRQPQFASTFYLKN